MKKSALKYEADVAHRRKHRWDKPHAEIIRQDGGSVGKCPSTLDDKAAQGLLDAGIPYWGRYRRKSRPERVYNVHEGVPYRAHIMGDRYHGFPEVPSELPPKNREKLREKAVAEGHAEQFNEWLKRYETL